MTVLFRQHQDIDPQNYIPQFVYSAFLWLGVGLILLAIVLFIWRLVSDGLLLVWRKTILEFFDPPR